MSTAMHDVRRLVGKAGTEQLCEHAAGGAHHARTGFVDVLRTPAVPDAIELSHTPKLAGRARIGAVTSQLFVSAAPVAREGRGQMMKTIALVLRAPVLT